MSEYLRYMRRTDRCEDFRFVQQADVSRVAIRPGDLDCHRCLGALLTGFRPRSKDRAKTTLAEQPIDSIVTQLDWFWRFFYILRFVLDIRRSGMRVTLTRPLSAYTATRHPQSISLLERERDP